jgi:hypothetical protein
MKQRIITALASLAFAAALLAHAGAEHITGFVKSVDLHSLTVETLKHETVTVLLTAKTEGLKSAIKLPRRENLWAILTGSASRRIEKAVKLAAGGIKGALLFLGGTAMNQRTTLVINHSKENLFDAFPS